MHVSTLISYLHYIDMYFTDFKEKKVGTGYIIEPFIFIKRRYIYMHMYIYYEVFHLTLVYVIKLMCYMQLCILETICS